MQPIASTTTGETSSQSRRPWRFIAYGFLAFALVLWLAALGRVHMTVTIALLFGWLDFAGSVLPSIRLYWPSIVTGIVCALIVLIGVHFTARWLSRPTEEAHSPLVTRPWKFRWSVSFVAIVVLLFVAGIAIVALVHQTTWLIDELQNKTAFSEFKSRRS